MEDKKFPDFGEIVVLPGSEICYVKERGSLSLFDESQEHPKKLFLDKGDYKEEDLERYEGKMIFELDLKVFNSLHQVWDFVAQRGFTDIAPKSYSSIVLTINQTEFDRICSEIRASGNKIIGIYRKPIKPQQNE